MIIELQSRKNRNKFYYPTQDEWEEMKRKGLDYNWKYKVVSEVSEPKFQDMPFMEIVEYQKDKHKDLKVSEIKDLLDEQGIEYKSNDKKQTLIDKLNGR